MAAGPSKPSWTPARPYRRILEATLAMPGSDCQERLQSAGCGSIVSNMKTTIDVAEALLREAREVASRDRTTLKDLVQEGLRRVLDERRPRREAFRLRAIEPVGGGFQPDFADGDWQRVRDEIYRGRGT